MGFVGSSAELSVNRGQRATNQINFAFPSLTRVDGGHLNGGGAGLGVFDVIRGFTDRLTINNNISIWVSGNLDTGFFGKRVEFATAEKYG